MASDYQGAWERGVYAVDAVVFHDGEFYECQVARTNANNQNPSNDANGWDLIPSLKKNVADSTGLSQVKIPGFHFERNLDPAESMWGHVSGCPGGRWRWRWR